MSRTTRNQLAAGREFWSRRPGARRNWVSQRGMKWWKRRTHKIERRAWKDER